MTSYRIPTLSLIALAVLAGCSTTPDPNPQLDSARNDFKMAQDNSQTRALAAPELKQASDALTKANESWARRDKQAEINHLSYLAKQRIAIAQETAQRKAAEQAIADAGTARDRMRLAARTTEADMAQRQAESAKRASDDALRQAEAAQRLANDTQARNLQLEAQIKDLDAKKTDRGLVVTIGDVLFDTGKAELKPGAARSVDKLAAFLKQYPQRSAVVEGFTDSVGSESLNMELSSRRADSVRMALVGMGVGGDRIVTRGYGKAYPVAGNDSAGGRQLNRRVEIILSEDRGTIAPR